MTTSARWLFVAIILCGFALGAMVSAFIGPSATGALGVAALILSLVLVRVTDKGKT